MRATNLFLTVALSMFLTGVVNAQPESDQTERTQRKHNPEMREQMIQEFDADGDGELNDEERQTARETMRERRGGPNGQARQGRGGPEGGRGPEGRPDPNELFDHFDENGDGQLSREEFINLIETQRQHRGGPAGPRADRGSRPGPPEGPNRPRRRPGGEGFGPPREFDVEEPPRLREPEDRPPLRNQFDGLPREGRGPEFGPGRPDGRSGPDPNEVFDRFDEDGDGQLSREEFMNFTDTMRKMRARMSEAWRGGPRPDGFRPERDRPRPERPSRPPRPELDQGAEKPSGEAGDEFAI